MGLFSQIFRSRDRPKDSTAGGKWNFMFGRSSSDKVVNERSALQVSAVYACIRVISEAVAQLPLHLYKYTDAKHINKEMATDHPLYYLLHDAPNSEMSSYMFRETMTAHVLLWGNAYAQIVRNGKGEVVALYPLMPSRMKVDRDNSGNLYYEYSIQNDENKVVRKERLKPKEVLHIKGLGFDGLVGYSPIAVAKDSIGLSIACNEYGSRFFANGATPAGILKYPGVIKDPEAVREAWNNGFGGSHNAGKVAVLEEGMDFVKVSANPEESQLLDTRKFQLEEIARIFRVPPHLIGDLEHSTFSNIEQQSLEFVTYTLQPWLVRWEQEIHRSLLNEDERKNYFVRFNVDGLLRGDYNSRMSGYATARQNGWMSANDIRRLEELDPIPEEDGGDAYLVNGNMISVKTAWEASASQSTQSAEQTEEQEQEPVEPQQPQEPDEESPEPEKSDGQPAKGNQGNKPQAPPGKKRVSSGRTKKGGRTP